MDVINSNSVVFIVFIRPSKQMLAQYRWWPHFSSCLPLLFVHTIILPLVQQNPFKQKASEVT